MKDNFYSSPFEELVPISHREGSSGMTNFIFPFEGGLRGMTNRNLLQIITILLLALSPLLQSCKDIKAKNITGETPVLILPMAHDTVATNPVHFKWEAIEGATEYHLQIASPSFSNISAYVLDSVITGTDFYFELDSNQYELKLTASNNAYTSKTLGPVLFYVGATSSTTPVTSQLVLTAPLNNAYVNANFDGRFSWNALTNASNYEFELRKGANFSSGQTIHTMTPGNSLDDVVPSANLPLAEGQYTWRVIANDANSTYLTQKINSFIVDNTKPDSAVLNLPVNNGSVSIADSVQFSWTTTTPTASNFAPEYSVIEVSSTINFATLLKNETVYGQTKKLWLGTFTSGTTYYWRVKVKDEAGNVSLNSTVFHFTAN
jgi:hypothetical protein